MKLNARLGNANIPVQVDLGFGDVVTPETIVAEKLQALVDLGMQNSRMKDFYDLWSIAGQFSFEGQTLVAAVRATFERRATTLSQTVPTGLSEEFATAEQKNKQWRAFLQRTQLPERDLPILKQTQQRCAFADRAEGVREGSTKRFDGSILLMLRSDGDPADPIGPVQVEEIVRDITALGGLTIVTRTTLAVIGFMLLAGRKQTPLIVLLATLGVFTFSTVLKEITDR